MGQFPGKIPRTLVESASSKRGPASNFRFWNLHGGFIFVMWVFKRKFREFVTDYPVHV